MDLQGTLLLWLRRLLLTALLLAAKCYEDTVYNNVYYAKVAGKQLCYHKAIACVCARVHLRAGGRMSPSERVSDGGK